MYWLLGRDPGTCAGCDAELERAAAWCGACGARVQPASAVDDRPADRGPPGSDEHHAAEGDGEVGGGHDRPLRRRALAATVVAAVAALVAAAVLRTEPPAPVLGEVGSDTGVTATAGPPLGLRVAWEQRRSGAGGLHSESGLGPSTVVADDALVRVDDTVVDVDSGRVVAAASWLAAREGAVTAEVRDDALVTVDTLTGAVVDRVTAPDLLTGPAAGVAVLAGDVAVVNTDDGVVLVRLDGSVVAATAGRHDGYLDAATADPAAVPLRAVPTAADEDLDLDGGAFRDGTMLPVRLVSTRTGEEVAASGDDARVRVAQVHGDVAILAETGGVLGEPGPSGASWQVLVLDAVTGELRQRVATSSAEPPRLVGVADDGTVVLGTRTGSQVELATVSPQGEVAGLAATRAAPDGSGSSDPFTNGVGRVAAVVGDLVVVLTDGEAVATDLTGTVRWRVGGGAEELAAGDGYVALLGAATVRVVTAADGATVTSFPRRPPRFAPTAGALGVVDGHVGIGDADGFRRAPQLGTTTWFDVIDGTPSPVADLFASDGGDGPGGAVASWQFHGTVAGAAASGPTVRRPPIVTSSEGRSSLRLLGAADGLDRIQLPTPDPTGPVGDLGTVIGVAPGRLAVTQYQFSAESEGVVTHLVDLDDGAVRSIPDWDGVLLTEGTLLAVRQGPRVDEVGLAGFDPVTGEQRWSSPRIDVLGHPRYDAQLLVASDPLGVTTLDLEDGTRPWRHSASSVLADLQPVLAVDRVLLATAAGEVVALDRADGTELWRTDVGAPVTALAGAGGDALVGTRDGLVVHLGADGRERQRIAVATTPVVDVATLGATTVAVTDEVVVGLRVDGDGVVTDDEVDLP